MWGGVLQHGADAPMRGTHTRMQSILPHTVLPDDAGAVGKAFLDGVVVVPFVGQ